jgi:hypothetical protein
MAYIGKKPSDISRAIATYDTFTGDGSTTAFDLTYAAGSANDIIVVVNNVRQEPGSSKSYTLGVDGSGSLRRVNFVTAPEASDEIYVINPTRTESIAFAGNVANSAITGQTELAEQAANDDVLLIYDTTAGAIRKIQVSNVSPSKSSGTATGDGSTVAFTINSGRTVDDVLVIVNGVTLVPTTDYTISSTTLTFSTAPVSGAEIQFRYI